MDNVKGKCYFMKSNKKPDQYKYLTEDKDTEVIIVGGGITGCLVSYYMSKAGIKNVVLERYQLGCGSTSASTSLLQYELDSSIDDLKQYTSVENAIKSYQLGVKALAEIDDFIKNYGNKCNYRKSDTLIYTPKKAEINEIKREYQYRKENGFNVRFIEDSNNPFSFDLKAGIYSVHGGAVLDPYLFCHQLAVEAEKLGANIYENTEVVKITYYNDKVVATTRFGYQITGKVIIAATGYNVDLFTKRQFGQKPISFNVVTKPVQSLEGWHNQAMIRDNETTYTYLRTTADNRIIIGGEDIELNGSFPDEKISEQKYEILLSRLKQMFPDINDIEVDYRYCGIFATTKDDMGFIGQDPEREKLWYCLGYGSNGILFSVLGGMFLSELFFGNPNKDMELFRVDRFDKKGRR